MSLERVSPTKVNINRAQENWGTTIPRFPDWTLRYYWIQGEQRLVWVSKTGGEGNWKYLVRIADKRIAEKVENLKNFTQERNYELKHHIDHMEKTLPRELKKSLGDLARDTREWGGGMDFESSIARPERVIEVSGGKSATKIVKIRDTEVTFHTHRKTDSAKHVPSVKDVYLATIQKPTLISYIDDNNKARFIIVESTNEEVPRTSKDEWKRRKRAIDNVWLSMTKPVGSKEFMEEYRSELNKIGYDFKHIDPSKTPITMEFDEKVPKETFKKSKAKSKVKVKRQTKRIGEQSQVMSKPFQIYNIGRMMTSRGLDDDDLPDGWTDFIDESLTLEENFNALMEMEALEAYSASNKPKQPKGKTVWVKGSKNIKRGEHDRQGTDVTPSKEFDVTGHWRYPPGMKPPDIDRRFNRHRQRQPEEFDPSSFRTVPLNHTGYNGKKFDKYNFQGTEAKAIVGKLKKPTKSMKDKWVLQSILIPK